MQWFGIFLFSLLGYGIKELAIRAITAVGFGLVTTYGVFTIFNQIETYFQAQLTGLPSDVLAILGIMNIDTAFSLILSAAVSKQVLNGWRQATNSRTGRVWKAPGSGSGGLGA